MSEQRICKVKLVDGNLEILLEVADADTERKTVIKAYANAHPDLYAAMQGLEPHLRTILCLPAEWCSNAFHVRSVSFSLSEKTGVEGAVISCSVDLTTCKAPFFFNTPYLPIQRSTEESVTPEMSPEALEALDKLKVEAQAYIDGKRVQRDLFEEAA